MIPAVILRIFGQHDFDLDAIARHSALHIVDSLVEGTVIAMFAALVVRAHRHHAGTRFTLWFSALMAIAVMPFVSGRLSRVSYSGTNSLPHPAITLPDSWALYAFAAWTMIAVWFLFGVARSLWHLRTLRSACIPLDPAILPPELHETLQRAQAIRRATLCVSEQVRVPTVLGLWKPVIVFPRWVINEFSPAELNQILLHELAHLRRYDDWTNLAQQLVRALFFFHPAIWWIESHVSLEREIACDDAVISATQSARSYAECLAHLTEKSLVRRSVALAQAALGKMRQVSIRVAQILDSDRSATPAHRCKAAVTLVAGFAVVSAVCASTSHELIAFQPRGSLHAAAVAPSFPRSLREGGHSNSNPDRISTESNQLSAARIVQANWKMPALKHPLTIRHAAKHASTSPKKPDQPAPNSLVHVISFDPVAVPFAETVFVVIHTEPATSAADPPVVQIQMWQVVVFHPPVDETKTSRKEI